MRTLAGAVCLISLFLFLDPILAFDLRRISNEEVIEDLHQLKGLIRKYYGPLEWKQRTLNFDLDKLIQDSEKDIRRADSEEEAFGVLAQALGKLNDGHVSITFPEFASKTSAVKLPLFLIPIENKAIVVHVGKPAQALGIQVGDEVVSIDGKPAMEFAAIAARYQSMGNPRSAKYLVYQATYRPSHYKDLAPERAEARVEFRKPNATNTITVPLLWRPQTPQDRKILFVEPTRVGASANAPVFDGTPEQTFQLTGNYEPFFASARNKMQFSLSAVTANEDSLAKFGLSRQTAPPIYAALLAYGGQNILLIRQPTYLTTNPDAYIQHYKAILSQHEPFVKVLVIDQTRNTGGLSGYMEKFFRLFISNMSPTMVQFMRADRKWVRLYETWAKMCDPTLESEAARRYLYRAKLIEDANKRGDFFVPSPIPVGEDAEVFPDPQYTWKKPVLVLTDELSGSSADIFPMLMKNAGFKTFGQPTMGLGGSVETVAELTNSLGVVNLTRGLFVTYKPTQVYDDSDYIENTGIPVDYSYEHTVEDFRNGYPKYLEAVAKAALLQTR